MELEDLLEILELGYKKHGEQPLTNRWLINILKKMQEREASRERLWDWAGPDDIF